MSEAIAHPRSVQGLQAEGTESPLFCGGELIPRCTKACV